MSRPQDVDRTFVLIAGAGALAVVVLVMVVRFSGDLSEHMPPMPAKPRAPGPASAALRSADYRPEMFEAYVKNDAAEYAISAPSVKTLSAPLGYERIDEREELKPGGKPLETRYLRLSAHVQTLTAVSSGGSYRTEHLVLRIENTSNKFLAYRVETQPAGGARRCMSKGDLVHNALALSPGETVERTECIFRKGMTLRVRRIETLTLPELSYYYVSSLNPRHIGMDDRTTRGHKPAKGPICQDIPEQAIRMGIEREQTTWRDVVDFYARHRCETYLFPVGYRAVQEAGGVRLPVHADDVKTGAR